MGRRKAHAQGLSAVIYLLAIAEGLALLILMRQTRTIIHSADQVTHAHRDGGASQRTRQGRQPDTGGAIQ